MASKTLTYSSGAKGWPSFYSFIPDCMIGMNNYFYTFKNGSLYRHNTNEVRNNFYAKQFSSSIKSSFNLEPTTVKLFKTIELEGDASWSASISTNLSTGNVNSGFFDNKEGRYHAFIRANTETVDANLRNVGGIGTVTSVESSNTKAVVLTFPTTIDMPGMMSINDTLYKNDNGSLKKLGLITSKTGFTITIDTEPSPDFGGSVPSNNDFILYAKNSIAESYGVRGYYMEFELKNNSTSPVELFSVGSSIFRSFP